MSDEVLSSGKLSSEGLGVGNQPLFSLAIVLVDGGHVPDGDKKY